MEFKEILKKLSVLNYDNGRNFTVRDRLDSVTELLRDTKYKKINSEGLFEMYAQNGVLPENPVLVSTHIDCASSLTHCFSEEYRDEYLRGTFDNLITNAAAVYLMTEQRLNENVVIVFTGDEECDSRGAIDVAVFLKSRERDFKAVILDVTDMGWDRNAYFSVENNFWSEGFGKKVVNICGSSGNEWCFVPSDLDEIPGYIPKDKLINEEALCDESWEYDENDIECFSLCIPVSGDMHDNSGVLVRKASIDSYINILAAVLNGMD